MSEKINRMVADLLSFDVPRAPAHEEVALEFGIEFEWIGAIEPLEFLQLVKGWRCRTRSGGRSKCQILCHHPRRMQHGPHSGWLFIG